LAVRRDRLALGETTRVGDVGCTSPLRTAYDLGRQEDLVEAVVAVDRLAIRHRFPPDLLLHFGAHYRGGPGTARLCRTLAHVNPSAGSPMESRLRMIIVRGGLPKPQVQWVVQDVEARTAVWLDLAWPDHRIGVEFEGGGHTTPVEVLRDAGRYTRLVDRGWRIYRYTKYDVYGDPGRVVAELARALQCS
jgi:very-short-patch-repair endonuclease